MSLLTFILIVVGAMVVALAIYGLRDLLRKIFWMF